MAAIRESDLRHVVLLRSWGAEKPGRWALSARPTGYQYHHPIESTFVTVRPRQRITKCPGSRAAGVAMAFKLIESAQARWRAVNAPHLVALVRAGARFEKGKLVKRPRRIRR